MPSAVSILLSPNDRSQPSGRSGHLLSAASLGRYRVTLAVGGRTDGEQRIAIDRFGETRVVYSLPGVIATMAKTLNEPGHERNACILLAGAGSSVHLGLPTLDDVLKQAVIGEDDVADRIRKTRESIEYQPRRFQPAVFEELIVRIKHYLATANMLRTDHTFRSQAGQWPQDIDNGNVERKWKQALTRCYRILLTEYGPDRIDPKAVESRVTVDLLKALCSINGGHLHVYTTNYDCSFQVLAANSTDLAFMTHIDNKSGRFTDNWHQANPSTGSPPRVCVHRLHGCIGWFNVFEPEAVEQGSIVREVYGAGSRLEIQNDDFLDQMCIKLIASQLIGTNPAFSSAFDEFAYHLKTAQILVVWGYSFRDLEVVRAINYACAESLLPLCILYLNPYLGETAASDAIRFSLLRAPIQPSPGFRPQQISWTPPDGFPALVPSVVNAVKSLLRRR